VLEYRRPGSSYDAGRSSIGSGLPNAGLAVWHIVEDADLQKNLNPPAAADNWYRQGVLLERAYNTISPSKKELVDPWALYTAEDTDKYGPVQLNWSDGSQSGLQVYVQPSAFKAMKAMNLIVNVGCH
jgi:hypothetical protein